LLNGVLQRLCRIHASHAFTAIFFRSKVLESSELKEVVLQLATKRFIVARTPGVSALLAGGRKLLGITGNFQLKSVFYLEL
jgi:hypothetical protein